MAGHDLVAHDPLSITVIGAGLALAFIGLCIYRVVFHPYAKYPGPFLAKITSWYSVYHTYIGDLHEDIWKCHERYGNAVRYGPNRLLINTDIGLKGIYSYGANVRKSKSYHRISLVKGVEATQSVVNQQAHAKLRRIISKGFSESYLRKFASEMKEVARILCERLGERQDNFEKTWMSDDDGWTCPKNMARWCDYFGFDVMSRLVFGKSYDMLQSAENHWIVGAIEGQLRRISFLSQLPEAEDLGLHRFLFPDARRRALGLARKGREMMEARRAAMDSKSADLFSILLAAKDPETGESLSQPQLWAESNLLIIAGSDTSSTTMAATFFYLSRNSTTYRKATKEVRSAFGSRHEVNQAKLSSCTYLRACITEAMRLCPPASGALWREVLPGGLTVGDLHIPEGYDVGTGIYSIHHNKDYFPDPFAFRPERWLPEVVGQEAVTKASEAYSAFSIGPRNCIGKSLATMEMCLVMASVISEYDFRAAPGELGCAGEGKGQFEGQYQTTWAFTSLKDGPYIQFKRVEKVPPA